eukprot:TRINITY_DN21893_c0_g4_i2.p1 TRINITY_DN21893_c0_g4~~TRINITY_DN21893_c0_g4_i2.p1  ORF type:complete len:434 (-),score=45.71 TRINITY_DN21893_c0_g4_i2:157-1290(-)
MACVFQGYAAYVALQRFLKAELKATTDASRVEAFTAATTLMHWGKLIMRVGHDAVFFYLSTRMRVLVAMMLVLISMLVPPVFVWWLQSDWMGLAFLHFGLLGIGVGVFEGTFLSVISPLGKETKAWAILGTPLGLAVVDIVCQLFHSKAVLNMNPVYFYLYIAVCMPFGMALFCKLSPKDAGIANKQVNILISLRDMKRWLPMMIPFFIAKCVGSFVMENTPGWFYVYNGSKVPLFSPSATTNLVDPDLYFVLIYIVVLLGDGISRRVVYYFPLNTLKANIAVLALAVLCSVVGFYLESFAIAVVTLLAAFLAFWGNGLGYGVAAKYIDSYVPAEHNRAVYSLWCMVGDVGGIFGALVVVWVNEFFCHGKHSVYECL